MARIIIADDGCITRSPSFIALEHIYIGVVCLRHDRRSRGVSVRGGFNDIEDMSEKKEHQKD